MKNKTWATITEPFNKVPAEVWNQNIQKLAQGSELEFWNEKGSPMPEELVSAISFFKAHTAIEYSYAPYGYTRLSEYLLYTESVNEFLQALEGMKIVGDFFVNELLKQKA